MRKVHNISQRVFWIKVPEQELDAWQEKARKVGYYSLQDYIRNMMNNENLIEQAKLSVKQDFDVKIEELKRQNEKLKMQFDTLILTVSRQQKTGFDIKKLAETNEKIIESGYTLEQWDRMCEEEMERDNENKILDREWDRLTTEQKQKARWYMNCRKCPLPEAIKNASKKLSDDFKKAFP
jgi:hypothetical protein